MKKSLLGLLFLFFMSGSLQGAVSCPGNIKGIYGDHPQCPSERTLVLYTISGVGDRFFCTKSKSGDAVIMLAFSTDKEIMARFNQVNSCAQIHDGSSGAYWTPGYIWLSK